MPRDTPEPPLNPERDKEHFPSLTPLGVESSRAGQIDLFAVSAAGGKVHTAWLLPNG